VGRTSSAAALVEKHRPIAFGIEESPVEGLGAGAGTAVDEQCRFALGVSHLFEVNRVTTGYLEVATSIGFLGGIGLPSLFGHWRHLGL